jgi:hypothetical protein
MAAAQGRARQVRTVGTVAPVARERAERPPTGPVGVRGRVPVAAAIGLGWAGAAVLHVAERWAARRWRARGGR